jgi:hypothetical protein
MKSGGAKGATFNDAVTKAVGEKLTDSTERMIHDASRRVVEHNAVREDVRYAGVARPGACEWRRLMAIRGAVFTTASKAIKGHDLCHCVAVPMRRCAEFKQPAHYAAREAEYASITKGLRQTDEPVTLKTVLREMRSAEQ